MDIHIYDENRIKIGIIDDANSIIWTKRYDTPGEFEIYLPVSPEATKILQVEHLVMREDDNMIGLIETVEITSELEDGDYIIASGRSIEQVLSYRVIQEPFTFTGKVEDLIFRLVSENAVHCSDGKRNLPGLVLGEKQGFSDMVTMQVERDNLLEVIQELCNQTGMGFSIRLNEEHKLEFSLYRGMNRSYDQNENPYVVFSDDYDNLLRCGYRHSVEGHCNTALVVAEEEDEKETKITVGDASGFFRREIYLSAGKINRDEEDLSDDQYLELLIEKGKSVLVEPEDSFDGEVEFTMGYLYKEDYDLGDVVTVEKPDWGIYQNAKVVEVVENEDESGYRVVPEFRM